MLVLSILKEMCITFCMKALISITYSVTLADIELPRCCPKHITTNISKRGKLLKRLYSLPCFFHSPHLNTHPHPYFPFALYCDRFSPNSPYVIRHNLCQEERREVQARDNGLMRKSPLATMAVGERMGWE